MTMSGPGRLKPWTTVPRSIHPLLPRSFTFNLKTSVRTVDYSQIILFDMKPERNVNIHNQSSMFFAGEGHHEEVSLYQFIATATARQFDQLGVGHQLSGCAHCEFLVHSIRYRGSEVIFFAALPNFGV